jgi:trimeric autotransporter adhesin
MSTAITRIQLKFSTGTSAPTTLVTAEPAYSYASNTFFIGSPTGDGVIAIGGKFYLDQQQLAWNHANAAFSAANNATDTYVRNHANAAFDTANAAFGTANGAVAVNLTQNNSITFASDTANAVFSNANSYITRNEAVNITQNNSIAAAFSRANNSLDANNGGTVTGSVTITGNLFVTGNVVSIGTSEIVSNDSLIILAAGNYATDILDIGFSGHYNDGVNAHTGFIRDATNKEYYVFDGYTPELGANNNINPSDPSFRLATVNANVKAQTVQIRGIDILPYANGIYNAANAAFVRANNSLNANTGGLVTGNITVDGTITPNADVTWNLGSPDKRWHSLFVGAGTIDIGGLTISNAKVNSVDTARFGGVQDIRISDAAVGSFRQIATQANSAFDHANAVFANSNTYITYNEAVSVTQNNSIAASFIHANSGFAQSNLAFNHANAAFANSNTYITYNEAVSVTQNNNITAALNAANAAFVRANNSLDANNGGSVSGSVNITSNVYAGNVIANGAVTSTGGTTKLVLSDIGLVSIIAGGAEVKFGASGIESSAGIFGGTFGGNKLVLNGSEANLISDRGDTVKIQTGTGGSVQNTFEFANNNFTAPNRITAGSTVIGGINVVPTLASSFNTANAAFDAANGAIAVNLTQNNSITASFAHANAAFNAANNATDTYVRNHANAAFDTANGAVAVNLTQNNSIAAAFTRANNSVDANNGGTITGDVIINANLFVNGTTTFVNTVNQLIGDNIITLNADIPQDGTPTQDAGFEIDRGIQPNSSFLWIESAGKFSANNGNTAFYVADEAVVVGAYNHANAAFNAANNATDTYVRAHANAAFDTANGAVAVNLTQNNSITASFAHANAAFTAANNATDTYVRNHANAAFNHANSGFSAANSAASAASTAQGTADTALTAAGNAQNTGDASFGHANAAFAQANTYATASASVFLGTGDGTTKSFNLGYTPVSDGSASVVSIDGIVQYEGSYTITTGNTSINFTEAPGTGERIRVLAYTSVNPYVLGPTGVTAGSYANANTIGVFTTAANGQLTFATNVAIAIGASQITSGILPVNRGGTGADTFTTNGVLIGQGASAFQTASSSTEGHVLTINSSGVPVFSYINGGTF